MPFAPESSAPGQPPSAKPPRTQKLRWLLVIGGMLVVSAVAAILVTSRAERARTAAAWSAALRTLGEEMDRAQKSMQPGAPVASLSVDALLAAYEENEFAAAAKYEGPSSCTTMRAEDMSVDSLLRNEKKPCPVFEVTGVVWGLGTESSGIAYVGLSGKDESKSVHAIFDKEQERSLAGLRRGQRTSVKCMVVRGRLSAPRLVRCSLSGT